MILYVKSSNGFIAQYGLEIQLPANFTDFPFIIIPDFLYFKLWVLLEVVSDKKWNIKKSFLIILQDKKALTLHTKNSKSDKWNIDFQFGFQ